MPSLIRAFTAVLLGAIAVSGCNKNETTPTPPTPPPTTPRAAIAVASTTVTGERRAEGGYVYRTVVRLTESGGATANITAVNLTFLSGTTAVLTTRFDQLVPSTGNTCPANSSVNTRELVSTDADAAHAFATTVRVEVTYGDATSTGTTANGTGTIPPLGPPPPSTYTLTGVISDPGDSHQHGSSLLIFPQDPRKIPGPGCFSGRSGDSAQEAARPSPTYC